MALSIHLGAHKTASTHLQNSLTAVRDDLRARGVCLVDPTILRRRDITLSRVLGEGADSTHLSGFARDLAHLRGDCARMLVTEENILGGTHRRSMYSRAGLLYPRATKRLRQVIAMTGEDSATLFLALRDPAPFNVSAFALQVSAGNEIEIGPYLRGRDPAISAWSGLVQRLADMPEVARLVVWRYEDYRDLLPRLLDMMLPGDLSRAVPEIPPANESLTQQGYDWFLRRAMNDSEVDLRILVKRARVRFARADGHAPLRPLDDADYARSAVNYAADVALLRDMPKVEFLQP